MNRPLPLYHLGGLAELPLASCPPGPQPFLLNPRIRRLKNSSATCQTSFLSSDLLVSFFGAWIAVMKTAYSWPDSSLATFNPLLGINTRDLGSELHRIVAECTCAEEGLMMATEKDAGETAKNCCLVMRERLPQDLTKTPESSNGALLDIVDSTCDDVEFPF
ncbi:hypothetical protein BKA80DRAFT_271546 [Phyllosticta citrichinensis]